MTRVPAGRRSRRSSRRADPARGGSAAGSSPTCTPATDAIPVSTSSGRTAGTVWRRTSSSRAPRSCGLGLQRDHGGAAVELPQPLLGHPLDQDGVGGEEPLDRGRRAPRSGAPRSICQRLASSRSARDPPGDSTTSTTSRPSGSASASDGVHVGGVDDLGEPDLEVLRLAGRPGRRGAGVGDPGVRVEARGVGHRHPGPEDRPLEGPAEVAVAGEAQPAALGVADPEPLDGRGLLLGLVTHPAQR